MTKGTTLQSILYGAGATVVTWVGVLAAANQFKFGTENLISGIGNVVTSAGKTVAQSPLMIPLVNVPGGGGPQNLASMWQVAQKVPNFVERATVDRPAESLSTALGMTTENYASRLEKALKNKEYNDMSASDLRTYQESNPAAFKRFIQNAAKDNGASAVLASRLQGDSPTYSTADFQSDAKKYDEGFLKRVKGARDTKETTSTTATVAQDTKTKQYVISNAQIQVQDGKVMGALGLLESKGLVAVDQKEKTVTFNNEKGQEKDSLKQLFTAAGLKPQDVGRFFRDGHGNALPDMESHLTDAVNEVMKGNDVVAKTKLKNRLNVSITSTMNNPTVNGVLKRALELTNTLEEGAKKGGGEGEVADKRMNDTA